MTANNAGMRFPVDPPTREEVAALFAACGTSDRGWRDQCLLVLLYRLGCRCSEALSVKWPDDVRRKPGGWTVRIMHPKGWSPKPGKGGKRRRPARPRELGLDPKSVFILESWIARRGDARGPLLTTPAGTALTPAHVRRLLPSLCRRAGIYRRINPHALRHAFACELVEEGAHIKAVQALMGHNHLQTTAHYIDSLTPIAAEVTATRDW